jgi:hypothetical protein
MACGGMQTMTTTPAAADISTLERACVHDPMNPANWEQLGAALASGGERERAATMYLQAATLRAHDLRDDYALLKDAPKAARATEATEATEAGAMPRTQVRRIGAALVEVLRMPVHAAPPASVRLEISNGNGVTGAAARLARSLEGSGVKTVRLTNTRPFTVPLSRIEYRREQQALAQQLGRRLGLPLRTLRADPGYADMRIVLGRDARYLK